MQFLKKSVTIPESVTDIGDSAFAECNAVETATVHATAISFIPKPNLKTVVITGGTSIGYSAFSNCTSLTSITIPEGVTDIGDMAFFNCTSLKSIKIPESVTSIGHSSFRSCSSLTNINIPEGVTSIGNSAFSFCNSLNYNEYDNAYYLGNENNPYLALIKAKDTFCRKLLHQ